VGIVGFIGMRHHAIGKRGIDRRRGHRRCDDGGSAVAAMLADVALPRLTRRQFRSGNHRGDGVEQMVFGVLRHLLRQRARCGCAHIGAKHVHHPTRTCALRENAHL
jgi:hypothetical protein